MRIDSYSIAMQSESSLIKSYNREESLRAWVDCAGHAQSDSQSLNAETDVLELSEQAKTMIAQETSVSSIAKADEDVTLELSEQDKQRIMVLQKMLEALTGKKIKFHVLEKLKLNQGDVEAELQSGRNGQAVQPRQGWGLVYDLHESYYEQEKMTFAAQGIIKTADGREIDFSVQLNLSRKFAAQQNISFRAGDAATMDPLVINFNGSAPDLTSQKYSFDLDADGQEEQISFTGPDSGFLALDLNGDGRINNGSELFGPNSGNGFADLAQYDEDGNQWIDENDSIYSRLQVWTKDDEGKDVLFALGQKGIGAIFLGNVDTRFGMKDENNDLLGQIGSSGIYLNENGTVGTIQHIDLSI